MEILKPQHPTPDDQNFLMGATLMFWDINKTKIDFKKHYRSIITRVLNYGSLEETQRLFQIYTESAIKEALIHPIRGEWHPKIYKAFCNLFSLPVEKKAFNVLQIRCETPHRANNIFKNL